MADEVNDLLYNGTKLYSGNRLVGYTTDKLSANIKIEENNGSANILLEDFPTSTLIAGTDKYYGYYKGVWIKYDGLTPKYLAQLGLHPGKELRFSKKNVAEFARKVLPKLEKSDYLAITGANGLRAILPPEAAFIFKLDYQDNNILCQAFVQYGKDTYLLNRNFTQATRREAKRENEVEQLLKQYFTDFKNNEYLLSNDNLDHLEQLLDQGIAKLKEIGEVQITPTFKSLLQSTNTHMEIGVSVNLTNELIDVDISSQKMSWENIQAALKAYKEKRHYFVLSNGLLQKTQQLTIEQLAQALHDLNISFTDFIHGKLQLPAYRSFYFAKEMRKANSLHFSSNESFNQLIKDLNKNELKQNKLPDKLKNVLRPYQKEGFNWLNTLVNYNFGGILADEMGLGKTLQVISLLLAHQKKDSTNLVVAPASVIYNWQNEAQKFAPELKTAVLGGTKKKRTQILANASKYDLLITSYQSLNRDLEAYQKLVFNIQILDEAQNIKNHQSITAQSVKVIKAHHKLALTGTPIENKLSELWSIFDYLMPNFLGSYLDFKKKFELPIIKDEDEEAEKQLVEMVTPFILRRLKKDVLNDLPAKEEEIVYVNMGSKQSELYKLQTQKLIAEFVLPRGCRV
ncbi:SNF2-related protein [Lactobacillus helveticus]|uniref:SNF2-related protein n=1 Tax=Lactobacillus helveticus TaxID=1587 RepID=UPI00345F15C4